jgi:hypothetical protein
VDGCGVAVCGWVVVQVAAVAWGVGCVGVWATVDVKVSRPGLGPLEVGTVVIVLVVKGARF